MGHIEAQKYDICRWAYARHVCHLGVDGQSDARVTIQPLRVTQKLWACCLFREDTSNRNTFVSHTYSPGCTSPAGTGLARATVDRDVCDAGRCVTWVN